MPPLRPRAPRRSRRSRRALTLAPAAARRDIKAGEQLTLDYATCHCVFAPFADFAPEDWKTRASQVRYGEQPRRLRGGCATLSGWADCAGMHFANFLVWKLNEWARSPEGLRQQAEATAAGAKLGGEAKAAPSEEQLSIVHSAVTNPLNDRHLFGVGSFYTVHKDVELRAVPELGGYGLFARADIPKGAPARSAPRPPLLLTPARDAGTVVWHDHDHWPHERLFSLAECRAAPPSSRQLFVNYLFQVGDDLFSGPTTLEEVKRDVSVSAPPLDALSRPGSHAHPASALVRALSTT